MKTSENVLFEMQFKEKPCYVLEIFIFFIFQISLSVTKVVTSWKVLEHDEEYIFEYIYWIENHLFMKQTAS